MTTSSTTGRQLLTGYNHNIPYRGNVYHVQSEFRSAPEPRIATQVFLDGQVVCSETCGADLRSTKPGQPVLEQMKAQHKDAIRRLISGRLGGAALVEATAQEPTRSGDVEEFQAVSASSLVQAAAAPGHLKLRHSLVRFVRAVDGSQPPSPEELSARLRSIVTSIAILIGGTHLMAVRKNDLAELLILRSEALEWLAQAPGEQEIDGLRLWRDFATIAESMSELSSRQTLVEHDLAIWKRFLETSSELPAEAPITHEQLVSVRSTWGRSKKLDEALEFPSGLTVGRLRALLEPRTRKLEALAQRLRQDNRQTRSESPV